MGFFITLLYISFAYLSPAALFPELAQYRIELILAICALLACIPDLPHSRFGRSPQLHLLIGLTLAVACSNILATRWFGGTLPALQSFMPNAIPLVLVGLTCKTVKRLRVLCVVLACIAVYYIALGARALSTQDFESVYILAQQGLPRIRGLASLNDPNDLAQFIAVLIPLVFLLWRRGVPAKAFTLLLTAVFCYGIFLTHSRGALVAVAAILLFAFKDRLGLIRSAVIGATVVGLMKVLQFTGGRGVSDESTMERLSAWGAGLQMFKSSPLFGIGFNQFGENYERTAHNSFLLSLTELGFFGYFFWMALLVFTIMQLTSIIKAGRNSRPVEAGNETTEVKDEASVVRRWAFALRVSLVGFLAAGWFLSRAYTMTLYVLLGMSVVVIRLSRHVETHGVEQKQPAMSLMLRRTVMFEVMSVIALYGMVRLRFLV